MSFTNKTPNYNLPQWLGTDKPAWITDVNDAFSIIDSAIKGVGDTGASAVATANQALSTAQTAQETAGTALTTANEAKTESGNATTVANNANQQAGTALTNANTALTTANSALECYSYFQPFNEVVMGQGITKRSSVFDPISRLICIYYKGLNLMEISFNIACSGKMEKYAPNNIFSGVNDYCIIQLPFTCTGSLTINNIRAHSAVNQTTSYTQVRYSGGTIRTIDGKGWLCATTIASDTSVTTIPENSTTSNLIWVNTVNLGEITLNGWTKIS